MVLLSSLERLLAYLSGSPNLLRQLDADNDASRIVERLEPQHRAQSPLHPEVVLLHNVVQVWTATNSHRVRATQPSQYVRWRSSLVSTARRSIGTSTRVRNAPLSVQNRTNLPDTLNREGYTDQMSQELIGIIVATIALAGIIVTGQWGMRRDIAALSARMGKLEVDLAARMGRLEGLIEGFIKSQPQPIP